MGKDKYDRYDDVLSLSSTSALLLLVLIEESLRPVFLFSAGLRSCPSLRSVHK